MWDRVKDQAKALQQSQAARSGGGQHGNPGPGQSGGRARGSSSGGSKAQLLGLLKSAAWPLRRQNSRAPPRCLPPHASMAECALAAGARAE
ncbi:TerB family tellurite resistance protein [Streptomyces hirsutus]